MFRCSHLLQGYIHRRAALEQCIVAGILEDGGDPGIAIDGLIIGNRTCGGIIRAIACINPDIF
jgi:hypothetical protein